MEIRLLVSIVSYSNARPCFWALASVICSHGIMDACSATARQGLTWSYFAIPVLI
jgi:hypothetical protein